MKKKYFAINLEDFHSNQEGAKTNVEILFIDSNSLKEAKQFVKREYGQTYSVITKDYFDKNIIR